MATGPMSISPRRRIRQAEAKARRNTGRPKARELRRDRRKLVKAVVNGFKLIESGKAMALDSLLGIPIGVGAASLHSAVSFTNFYQKLTGLKPIEFKTALIEAGVLVGAITVSTALVGAGRYAQGRVRVGRKFPLLKAIVWGKPGAASVITRKLEPFDIPDKYLNKVTAWGKGKEA